MKLSIRSLAIAALLCGVATSFSSAQVGGGTPGGSPGPGPIGGPLGGGYPPDVMKHVREILAQGKSEGWSRSRTKSTVNAYLVSKGYPPIP